MNFDALFGSAALALASALTWGAGDFSGGLATRRAKVAVVVFFSQLIGLALLIALAFITRERMPAATDVLWGAASGIAGLIGLSALYSALSKGNMGLVAPVTGVISTAMPVLFGALSQGLPHPLQMLGFVLAIIAVGLISRTGNGDGRPAGLGLAVIAGVSFGAFLILIAQTGEGAVFWPLAAARTASVICLLFFMLLTRGFAAPAQNAWVFIALAGVMDAAGNFLFVLAEQAGRLDVAGALSSLYPASTTLLALIFLRERPHRWHVAGIVLTFIAIVLIVAA
jgi:drug/metabolite transporter (DMT)-like permease